MTTEEILRFLQGEIEAYPERASGHDYYRHMDRKIRRLVESSRDELVAAFKEWIRLRKEPHTMLAIRLGANYELAELRDEILFLRKEVEGGRAFLPYYVQFIDKALGRLDDAE